MSQEKVYALSLLACVLYSFGLLMFRWVYNYMDSLHFPASFTERIAYGRYQYAKQKAWLRILRDVMCCVFCMLVGLLPWVNVAVAVTSTIGLMWLCIFQLTEGL